MRTDGFHTGHSAAVTPGLLDVCPRVKAPAHLDAFMRSVSSEHVLEIKVFQRSEAAEAHERVWNSLMFFHWNISTV